MKHLYRWSEIGAPSAPGVYQVGEFDITVRQQDLDRLAPIVAHDPTVEFIEATHNKSRRRELIVGLARRD